MTTFKNSEVRIETFINKRGNNRCNVFFANELIFSFNDFDIENTESFNEDVIGSLRDSTNRSSPFNKKADCVEFAALLIEMMQPKEEVKPTKSEIFKEAWGIVRTSGKTKTFSQALKIVWMKVKTGCKSVLVDTDYKNVFYPIFNENQVKFMSGLMPSKFPKLLTEVLLTKESSIERMTNHYLSLI